MSVKKWLLVFLSTTVIFVLTGCQQALNIGAVNNCGRSIEINANELPDLPDLEWVSLSEGASKYLGSASTSAERIYFWVRLPGDGQSKQFDIAVRELAEPSSDARYETRVDREIVLGGEKCPPR